MADQTPAALAALGNWAATDELIAHIVQAVLDRASHEHPAPGQGGDPYCLNLTAWMGGCMGPVLVRLCDAEAERDALRAQRNNAVAIVAKLAQRLTTREREHNADRALMEQLRTELADLQGQNALTEHHFNNYVDDAIREQNTLRERVAVAERDAARWRRIEPILTRADRREVPYLDIDGRSLTEIAGGAR